MLCLLSVNKKYSGIIRANIMLWLLSVSNKYCGIISTNIRYGKMSWRKKTFLIEMYFLKWWVKKTVSPLCKGRASTPTIFKADCFVTVVNSWKPLSVFRKNLTFRRYRGPSSAYALSTFVRFYNNHFGSSLKLKCIS